MHLSTPHKFFCTIAWDQMDDYSLFRGTDLLERPMHCKKAKESKHDLVPIAAINRWQNLGVARSPYRNGAPTQQQGHSGFFEVTCEAKQERSADR